MPRMVVAITAAAIALFEWLGFLTTNVLLIFALLVVIERRRLLPAPVYSIGVVVVTYVLFVYALKTPLADRTARISRIIRGKHSSQPGSRLFRRSCAGQRVVRVSRLPRRHARRRLARHRSPRRHFHPVAGDVRPERDAGDHHARRHLLWLAIRRLDHLDPDADPGRGFVGDDLHRRLRHGEERPRRRGALHRGGRLMDRRHIRRAGAHRRGTATGDHRASASGRRNTRPCSSSA